MSGFQFVPNRLIAVADTAVSVQARNSDPTAHSFGIYRDASGREPLIDAVRVAPGEVVDITFTSPPRGSYILRCEVHPDRMIASFVAASY